APLGRDRRGLGDDQTRAADGPRAEVHEMPVARRPILRGILAHRRDANAVAHRDGLDCKRVKEMGHGIADRMRPGRIRKCAAQASNEWNSGWRRTKTPT